jgi:hypothetical protein
VQRGRGGSPASVAGPGGPEIEWPPRKYLSAIIDDIDDEATVKKKQEKALAEHVARHLEDVGRKVEDFNWILSEIVRSWQGPPA